MYGCFSLDSLGNVDCELYAILAQCASRLCPIDRSAAVAAKNTREELALYIRHRGEGRNKRCYLFVRLEGLRVDRNRGIQIHRHNDGAF